MINVTQFLVLFLLLFPFYIYIRMILGASSVATDFFTRYFKNKIGNFCIKIITL